MSEHHPAGMLQVRPVQRVVKSYRPQLVAPGGFLCHLALAYGLSLRPPGNKTPRSRKLT